MLRADGSGYAIKCSILRLRRFSYLVSSSTKAELSQLHVPGSLPLSDSFGEALKNLNLSPTRMQIKRQDEVAFGHASGRHFEWCVALLLVSLLLLGEVNGRMSGAPNPVVVLNLTKA